MSTSDLTMKTLGSSLPYDHHNLEKQSFGLIQEDHANHRIFHLITYKLLAQKLHPFEIEKVKFLENEKNKNSFWYER